MAVNCVDNASWQVISCCEIELIVVARLVVELIGDSVKDRLLEQLQSVVGASAVRQNELMSLHTTFKIGGPARYLVTPHTDEEVCELIKLFRREDISHIFVGNGSNLLVSDDGFDGVVVVLGDAYAGYEVQGKLQDEVEHELGEALEDTISNCLSNSLSNDISHITSNSLSGTDTYVYVTVRAGMMLARLGNELARQGISGFEFATGIPGTIGGAIRMNAGAYGGEMKDIVESVRVADSSGDILDIPGDEMEFAYRSSKVDRCGYVVLGTVLKLHRDNPDTIRETLRDLSEKRRSKQPLEYPSAGSTFKRPEGYFAAKLIEDAGLKGFSVGGAAVSDKHAGFVVNLGGATAIDVCTLTDHVRDVVYDKFGVELELEVVKVGM